MPGWEEATAVEKLSSNSYAAVLHDDWCIGTVPNGGYVTGTILQVVKTHFATSLAKQNQPHTIALHVEFLRRTQAGPATLLVDDVKLGRQTSIVHVRLEQDGRREVLAYATNSNMHTEAGFSYDTQYQLHPPVPAADVSRLAHDTDALWARQPRMPFASFRKASAKVHFFFPRAGQPARAVADEWLCFADGRNFHDTALGFVADMFPQMIESWRREDARLGPFWYPTLLLNLEIKKLLPEEGVRWLHVRVQMKSVRNGRMDLEVLVRDALGELVALSQHVAFVVDAARNTAKRRRDDTRL
ncbi:hypothetical protein ACN47E_001213 [Coniothyrium glycines]